MAWGPEPFLSAHVIPLEWRDRLVCSRYGGREVDMVVTGERRRLKR
jgi:hypothetical protein